MAVTGDDGETLAAATARDIEVSYRIGSIPRRLSFPDGSVFETADNDAIDGLFAGPSGRAAGFIAGLERFRPRLAVFVVAVALLSVALYRYALPAMVEVAVLITPPVVPELMGRSALASLDRTLFAPSELDDSRRDEIANGFAELSSLSPGGRAGYTLNFRKGGPIGPNAFALPDGSLVITDELVELADDGDEILGVLAHEIGHVVHRHSLRQLYRAAGVTGMILLIGGDVGGGMQDLLVQGAALASLANSRAAEAEADRYSVELMYSAGRDPAAIARFFELLRDKLGDNGGNAILSTHPATPERIDATRKYAEEIAKETGR